MKFTINSGDLLSAVQTVAKAQGTKSVLPILDCIRLELTADGLHLMGADPDQTITTQVAVAESADINQKVCIPTTQFLQALKELPNQPITFSANNQSFGCVLEYANGVFNFIGQDATDFPMHFSDFDKARQLTLTINTLTQGLQATKNSISEDTLRPQMNGVYVDVQKEGSVIFVASDGHSLTRDTFLNQHQVEEEFGFIIPTKTVQILPALLNKMNGENEVQLTLNETNLFVKAGDITLTTRLVEGRYPNYNAVIPKDNPFIASIDRDSLIGAIRRILVFASAATALIKFDFTNDELKVSAQDFDLNTSANETIPCEYQHEPVAIGFSGTMLIDLLRQMPPGNINMALADASRAATLTPAEHPEEEELLLLLMPMIIQQN